MAAMVSPQGTEEERPIGRRRRTRRIPIWIRVSMITAVVMLGVLLGTMVLAGSGIGDRRGSAANHGSGGEMQMHGGGSDGDNGSTAGRDDARDHGSADHGSGLDRGSGGGHGRDDQAE